jgi:predicted nucleotidyltransferase
MTDSAILNQLRRALAQHPAIRIAFLFGSLAQGTESADSDLDIAVGAGRPLETEEKTALVGSLAEALGRPVDLVDLATAGEPLLGQILGHGQRIVGNNSAYAELLIRHLNEQADFLPYRERILAERRRAWIES